MTGLPEIILAAILATDLILVSASRLLHCIRIVAIQGFLLGILPLVLWQWNESLPHAELLVVSVVNIAVKCYLLPYLLKRTMRSANVKRELEPLVGYSISLLILLGVMVCSFIFGSNLPVTEFSVSPLVTPVAFTTMGAGLLMIVGRRKAITQVIGFLAFENGIGIFGAGMMLQYGLIVELGILLDVFVLVFIMGIAVFRISREFDHIDSDRLNRLGDFPAEVTPRTGDDK